MKPYKSFLLVNVDGCGSTCVNSRCKCLLKCFVAERREGIIVEATLQHSYCQLNRRGTESLLFNVEIYGLFISCQHGGWKETAREWRESRSDLWAERVSEDSRGETLLTTGTGAQQNMPLQRHLFSKIITICNIL